MSKISVIAKLTAVEGKNAELEQRLAELITAAEEEQGLEVYSVHQDAQDPNTYYFFELYQGDEALSVHGKGDQVRSAMRAMGGLLVGRPEVTMMKPVAAKGLSL